MVLSLIQWLRNESSLNWRGLFLQGINQMFYAASKPAHTSKPSDDIGDDLLISYYMKSKCFSLKPYVPCYTKMKTIYHNKQYS